MDNNERIGPAWPYYPSTLSEVFGEKDIELIQLLQTGIQEKLHLPTKIVEFRGSTHYSYHSYNKNDKYPEFCLCLQSSYRGSKDCEDSSAVLAREYIEGGFDTVRRSLCFLGLTSLTHGITVAGKVVAVLSTGKFLQEGGLRGAKNALHDKHKDYSEDQQRALLPLLELLPEKKEAEIIELERLFKDESDRISRIAEHYFRTNKKADEDIFLREQGSIVSQPPASNAFERLRETIGNVLTTIRLHIGAQYLAIFSATETADTVLSLTAESGLSPDVHGKVHFNWRKAGLATRNYDANKERCDPDRFLKGVKGYHAAEFENAVFVQPYQFVDGHRGLMVIGPFNKPLNIDTERQFLHKLCHLVGWRVLGLFVLKSLKNIDSRRNSNIQLAAHGIRSGLQVIRGEDSILNKKWLLTSRNHEDNDRISTSIELIAKEVESLSKMVTIIMRSPKEIITEIDITELELEKTSLAVLLQNCFERYTGSALDRNVNVRVDSTIEFLPEISADILLLDLAFANLMDNAVKYTFPGKEIFISGESLRHHAIIKMRNYGRPIRQTDVKIIFDVGVRSNYKISDTEIIGMGLGLPQTKRLIELHGGSIEADCGAVGKDNGAFVTFTVTLPIRSRSAK